jgi:hypothetical protein
MPLSPLRIFFSGLWLSIPAAAALGAVFFVYPGADYPLSDLVRPLLVQAGEWLLGMAETLETSPLNTALLIVATAHLLAMLLTALRLNHTRKAAAFSAERTRACPSCAALIQVQATICRHCHTPVKRPYVDDHFAGEQIQKLLSMHALGMTNREIAELLNSNGELLLRDHSVWTARKVAALLARAKKARGAA